MPATYLLATSDSALHTAWAEQLGPDRVTLPWVDVAAGNLPASGLALVVILDAIEAQRLPAGLAASPTVVVGEPHTHAYEHLRLEGRSRVTLTYEESRHRLGDFLILLDEIAERGAALDLLVEKSRRPEASRPRFRPVGPTGDMPEFWDFLEGAVENLGSPERLLAEFRRAARYLLRASHTVFFLREAGGFRADRGSSYCPLQDPVVTYLGRHPLVLDGETWSGPADPLAELAARNRLALWGARLLVPWHERGQLLGLMVCGVRDDGQPYDEADKSRAVFLARLLRQFLHQGGELSRLGAGYERRVLGDHYLPQTLVLSPHEQPARQVPLAVRSLIGEVRRTQATTRLRPAVDQPFRAAAGIVAETGGVWAYWEEVSGELHDELREERAARLSLWRDLAFTLNHELGNALVSLGSLRHVLEADPRAAALHNGVRTDVARLESLNNDLLHLATLSEAKAARIDLRALMQRVGEIHALRVEVPPEPVELAVVATLLEFSLVAIVQTLIENRASGSKVPLSLQLRATGEGEDLTALVSMQGDGLELEGILPGLGGGEVPNQGRLPVFIAKEILRLHHGEIHAGPGLGGTEILLSLRRW